MLITPCYQLSLPTKYMAGDLSPMTKSQNYIINWTDSNSLKGGDKLDTKLDILLIHPKKKCIHLKVQLHNY